MPLGQLPLLPRQVELFAPGGPINSRAAIMVGSWWMCRELELATARAKLVEFERVGRGVLKATLHLPSSKTDLRAEGVSRSLLCACSSSSPSACVVHVLLQHLGLLMKQLPDSWSPEGFAGDLQPFPMHPVQW